MMTKPVGGCFPETLVGDYFDGEPFDLEELLGSNPPEAQGGSVKGPEYYQGVEASQWGKLCILIFLWQDFLNFGIFRRAFS